MKRYLTILSASVALAFGGAAYGQDIHFSQFYENAVLRNPALTGIFTGDYKIGMDYRTQWGNSFVPYNTVMVSGETRILVNRNVGDYLSIGLVGTYDKAGTINFTSTQLYPAISFNKALEDQHNSYLSVGFTGGYINRSVDQSLMTTSYQWQNGLFSTNNPTGETSNFKSFSHYDLGAGVSLNSSLDQYGKYNYYLGASAYHINRATQIFSGGDVLIKLPVKWQFSGGIHLPLSEQFTFTAQANYSVMQPYSEFLAGGMFTYKSIPPGLPSIFAFSFGMYVRSQDAVIPTFKIDYKDLAFGFSYDVNNSSLSTGANGASATEITLYLKGHYEHKKNPRDPVMCPRFEDDINPNNTFRY